MCGISGVWGQVDGNPVLYMMEKQAHRGPDGKGLFTEKDRGVLGHRRLSIIDPEGGSQPIYNENQSAVIVANGEVYNHLALRRQLESRHRFGTTSDTETILHLFEERGLEVARNLDGMFAFAVAEDDALFLARDPIGIKPLYYGVQNEGQVDQTF